MNARKPTGGDVIQRSDSKPAFSQDLFEYVLEPGNLQAAFKRVRANKGVAGIDGMTIDEFQKMQKNYQKFKGMKKQIQRVALAQHAESHPHCPAIEKMKKDAGVSNVRELPSPFRDAR